MIYYLIATPIKRLLLYFLLFIFINCHVDSSSDIDTIIASDTIYSKIKNEIISKQPNSDSIRSIIQTLPSDTIKRNLLFNISYHYLQNEDSLNFRYWNNKTFEISRELKDKSKIAESYWDLASFYYKKNVIDSAYSSYYKSYKYYKDAGDDFKAGRMLLSMGVLQAKVKDFIGSQVTTIKALKLLEPYGQKKQLYNSYNNLAVSFNGLKDYPSALEYHEKANELAIELNDKVLLGRNFNNTGVVYREMGKDSSAITFFKKGLNIDGLEILNPALYAMLLDNMAYSNFNIGNTNNFLELNERALNIRRKIDHGSGLIVNYLHLAEFYKREGEFSSANSYIDSARYLAVKEGNNEYLLEALKLASNIKNDSAVYLLNRYIDLSDKLQREERLTRNKFASIRYETEEYIEQNQNLTRQKFLIVILFLITLLFFLLIYIVRERRIRKKEYEFEKEQNEANQKIYELMLDKQQKLEEGRLQERLRISEELHDGVISDLFGTRMGLGLLELKFPGISKTSFDRFIANLQKIEEDLRSLSHKLRDNLIPKEFNFVAILKNLIEETEESQAFDISYDLDPNIDWDQISNEIKINTYRILQEVFKNIIKHADASKVELKIFKDQNDLLVQVRDNGIGFTRKERNRKGIGLKNINSRIERLKGKHYLHSSNTGTYLKFEVPLE